MAAIGDREPTIHVEIDWLDDGSYAHPMSELRDRLIQATLSVQRGRDSARPLAGPMVAAGSCGVHNQDRLLSPEFAGSPVYQLVEPGRAYRFSLDVGGPLEYDAPIWYDEEVFYDGASNLRLLTGFLEEPSYESGLGPHVTTLACIGQLSRLRGGTPISTPLYENIRTDQALGYLLDAAGWPAALRRISFGDSTLELWWLAEADPFSAAVELLAAEGVPSALYEAADGAFVFENRNYRTTVSRSTTVRHTYSDRVTSAIAYDANIAYDAPVFYDAGAQLTHGVLSYAPAFADVRNQAIYAVSRRAIQSLQKVWEYGQSLTLGASESRLITVVLSDPCTAAVAPTAGGATPDYTLASGALASVPTLEAVNAQRIGIRFIAGLAGAVVNGVTSNGPQLRARPWTEMSRETVTNSVDASSSIARTKGARVVQINGTSTINPAYAQAVCNAAVNYYKDHRPIVEMPFENIDSVHLAAQVTTEISDRVAIVSEQLGMTSGTELWVEQIRQQRQPAKLVTTLVCSRVDRRAGGGRWNEALWGAFDNQATAGRWGE